MENNCLNGEHSERKWKSRIHRNEWSLRIPNYPHFDTGLAHVDIWFFGGAEFIYYPNLLRVQMKLFQYFFPSLLVLCFVFISSILHFLSPSFSSFLRLASFILGMILVCFKLFILFLTRWFLVVQFGESSSNNSMCVEKKWTKTSFLFSHLRVSTLYMPSLVGCIYRKRSDEVKNYYIEKKYELYMRSKLMMSRDEIHEKSEEIKLK